MKFKRAQAVVQLQEKDIFLLKNYFLKQRAFVNIRKL